MIKQYILLNAYFNQNLGDDLFLYIIANRYPSYNFLIFSRYKRGFPENFHFSKNICSLFLSKVHSFLYHRNLSCRVINFGYSQLIRNLVNNAICCVYIIGSGFIEKKNGLPNKEFLEHFYSEKTFILGCNFGPFRSPEYYREYYKLFQKVADVCFRETYSKELFASLKLRCESDIVFSYNLGEELPPRFSKGNYIVLSVIQLQNHFSNECEVNIYKEFLVKCILYWSKYGKDIVITAFCKNEGDLTTALEIKTMVQSVSKDIVIEICAYPDYSYKEMMGILKNSDLIIATRYHAMIIGFLYKKLVYPIVYSDKVVHVIHDIFGETLIAHANDLKDISLTNFFENYGLLISSEKNEECINSANRQFEKLDDFLLNHSTDKMCDRGNNNE